MVRRGQRKHAHGLSVVARGNKGAGGGGGSARARLCGGGGAGQRWRGDDGCGGAVLRHGRAAAARAWRMGGSVMAAYGVRSRMLATAAVK